MAQIQEGLRILQEEAPDVFSSMTNISSNAFSSAAAPSGTSTTEPATESSGNTTSEGTEGSASTPSSGNTLSLGNMELASLMASLLNVAPPAGQTTVSICLIFNVSCL